MNCFLETIAGAYLQVRSRFAPPLSDEDLLGDAEENLESYRGTLLARERDLTYQSDSLARAALARKKAGDLDAARFAIKVGAPPLTLLPFRPCFDLRP
jgi:hypothetical protein